MAVCMIGMGFSVNSSDESASCQGKTSRPLMTKGNYADAANFGSNLR